MLPCLSRICCNSSSSSSSSRSLIAWGPPCVLRLFRQQQQQQQQLAAAWGSRPQTFCLAAAPLFIESVGGRPARAAAAAAAAAAASAATATAAAAPAAMSSHLSTRPHASGGRGSSSSGSSSSSSSSSAAGMLHPQHKLPSMLVLTKDEVDAAHKATDQWLRVVEDVFLPSFDYREHKGRYGKVCVIGGSAAFTGAPYFVAAAALRMGADLATVITTPSAAVPIKSYSPELLVYPILPCRESPHGKGDHDAPFDYPMELARLRIRAEPLLRKADVIVIGPGLGGSSNYRIHDEDEGLQQQHQHQQQQQQQQQQQGHKSGEKSGGGGRLSQLFKGAMEDVHKVVRGSSSSSSAADQKAAAAAAAAAAADPTNPATMDHARLKAAAKEAEAAAAVTQKAAIMLLRLCIHLRKPLVSPAAAAAAATAAAAAVRKHASIRL
ncbi:ATP-dependent (S)-NAD(P)H-hydrate dehydratase, related [Eimeria brunetti]|uniref:ATP-dependent (S)-NAD(P)H-hydrate dehydratase, related n=1 Tax=Eimeria brunetti TaxID=51314 RepID=U6LXH8_9EIME|nr:ATP-dependent (S)-NAD(P)H-hydrate dehydratase, related [Eimeria brunetti]